MKEDKDAPLYIKREPGGSEIIAIGGGKGGIGKSMISASIGICLAERGRHTLMVDADLGGANLHTVLGVTPPKATLSDFIERRIEDFSEVVAPTRFAGLSLACGALDVVNAANLKYAQKARFLKEVSRYKCDVTVLDLGAGTAFNTVDFFLVADVGLVVATPEPTSIENAYRFIKTTFFRKLKHLEHQFGIRHMVDALMAEREQRNIRTPVELLRTLSKEDPDRGRALAEEIAKMSFGLVINQVRDDEDKKLGQNIRSVCQQYFGIAPTILGVIPHDNVVWQAVKKREAVVKAFPNSAVAEALRKMVDDLPLTNLRRTGSNIRYEQGSQIGSAV